MKLSEVLGELPATTPDTCTPAAAEAVSAPSVALVVPVIAGRSKSAAKTPAVSPDTASVGLDVSPVLVLIRNSP